jgi:hypothetical protein
VPASTSWLLRLWRSNPAAAWTGALGTVVLGAGALFVALFGSPWLTAGGPSADPVQSPSVRSPSAPSPSTSAAVVTAVAADPLSAAARAGTVAVAPGSCGSPGTGAPLDCTASGAWVRVDAGACDLPSVLARWGVDPDLTALLVTLRAAGSRCWAAPGSEATGAGATADDVRQVTAAAAPDVLRACARGVTGTVTVPCSVPHELEWVGGWQHLPPGEATGTCTERGRRYTDSSLTGLAERVEAVAVQGKGADGSLTYRCALRVPGASLTASLHGIGEGPLPTT